MKKIFIACDTTDLKKVRKIVSQTKIIKLKLDINLVKFMNSKREEITYQI